MLTGLSPPVGRRTTRPYRLCAAATLRDRSRRSSGTSWSRGASFRIRKYPVSQALAVSDQRPDQSKQLLMFWTLMVLRQKISDFKLRNMTARRLISPMPDQRMSTVQAEQEPAVAVRTGANQSRQFGHGTTGQITGLQAHQYGGRPRARLREAQLAPSPTLRRAHRLHTNDSCSNRHLHLPGR